MTAEELIEELKKYPPDSSVLLCDYDQDGNRHLWDVKNIIKQSNDKTPSQVYVLIDR